MKLFMLAGEKAVSRSRSSPAAMACWALATKASWAPAVEGFGATAPAGPAGGSDPRREALRLGRERSAVVSALAADAREMKSMRVCAAWDSERPSASLVPVLALLRSAAGVSEGCASSPEV